MPNLWTIFCHNWTHCIDANSLLLQRYVKKGIDAKNPANSSALKRCLPVFVRSRLSLTYMTGSNEQVPISESKNWNMKIGIRISIFTFCENWKIVFLGDRKLKFDAEFQFSFFLEFENWKLKCIFLFQFSRRTVGTRVHALLPIDFDETSMFVQ